MDPLELLAIESAINSMVADCDSLAKMLPPNDDGREVGAIHENINTLSDVLRNARANPAAASEAVLASALRRATISLEQLRSLIEAAGDMPTSEE